MIFKWISSFRIWSILEKAWNEITPPIDAWLQETYGGEYGCIGFVVDFLFVYFLIVLVLGWIEKKEEGKKKDDT